jgi:uncharacterized membrane protein YeaQ/YmgE (transglycosylase-associated protein family)
MWAVWWVLSTLVAGLVIGGLARLVVPGPNPIGIWRTALCGAGGSVIGRLVAALLFGGFRSHWQVSLVLEVLVAAALVSAVTRRRRLA